MLLIVTFISLLVQIYSFSYMEEDPHRARFSLYLHLFTFFMLVLVLSPNYFQLFLGWEGVGLTSYLLVNFWFTRIQANKSGLKALFVNRIGDYFYLFGLCFLMFFFKTTSFSVSLLAEFSFELELILLFFILASSAKSAQLGLHTWLPDAMEGPTPVSALIHAATMVTAGIFLLLRTSSLLSLCSNVSSFLLLLGSLTAFFAASVGALQYDLKKIIAYSTCSQLGYMAASIGAGSYDICLYHLVNHAFFKALLFLTAGIVIHSLSNEQDIRKYGGLIKILPYSYLMMLIGSLGLTGLPFLSGYYSKEGILESLITQSEYFSYILLVLTAVITAYYSFRSLYLVFGGTPRFSLAITHLVDANFLFLIPTLSLSVFTVFHGFITRDLYLGFGENLNLDIPFNPVFAAEFGLSVKQKLLPLFFSSIGGFLGFFVFRNYVTNINFFISSFWLSLIRFLNKRWWFDLLDTYVSRDILLKSKSLYSSIERGYNEQLGYNAVSLFVKRVSLNLYSFHNGHVYFIIIFSFFAIIFYLLFFSFSFVSFLPFCYGYYKISKR